MHISQVVLTLKLVLLNNCAIFPFVVFVMENVEQCLLASCLYKDYSLFVRVLTFGEISDLELVFDLNQTFIEK